MTNIRLTLFAIALAVSCAGFAQSNPVPLVHQPLLPFSAAPGAATFTLTVNGAGFVSGAVVDWNGAALVTQFISTRQLTATVPASNVSSAGTASLTVLNPGGQRSSAAYFTVATSIPSAAFTEANYTDSNGPGVITTADFNGDNKLDVAVIDAAGLTLRLGNGDGTFQAPVTYSYTSGESSYGIIAGDFNGDGKVDLAFTLEYTSPEVAVSLGNGDGTFQPPIVSTAVSYPTQLIAADFNQDGKLDLVVNENSAKQVVVMLGKGDGSFQPPVTYSIPDYGSGLAVADFNGDGIVDLAAGFSSRDLNGVFVMLGNGDGTFQPGVEYKITGFGGQLFAGDMNADGNVDLVGEAQSGITILYGNGDGTFQPETQLGIAAANWVTAADLNDDGILDFASGASGFFYATIGEGGGTYQPPVSITAPYGSPWGLVADFNNDGRPDVLTSNGSANSISVFLQSTTATDIVSPSSLTFGTQAVETTSPSQRVYITNTGGVNIEITSISLSDADFLQTNTCGTSVAPYSLCHIDVSFKPLKKGAITGTLSIADNVAGSPQNVSLSGTGTFALITPTYIDFGGVTVGQSKSQSVSLQNLGNTAMSIGKISVTGRNYSQTNNCGTSLASGAVCTITVTFSPVRKGTLNSTLSITDSGGGSPQKVTLTGTGQ